MESKIAKLIHLKNQPVAVLHTDVVPENAVQFKEGVWGCSVALLVTASRGKTAVFAEKTTACLGAKTGLGFQDYPHGWIEYFLSTGGEHIGREGEFYKKTPELARDFIENIKRHDGKPYVVCKPLRDVLPEERPLAVIFLGLGRTLSGRDRAHHNTCGTREPQLHRQHPHLLHRHEPPRSAVHPRRKLPPRPCHCRPLAGGMKPL